MSTIEQQTRNTEANQLKLDSELRNHGHGNRKRIEDLSVQLSARLNDTEGQIKGIETNITNEIALLQSQANENITELSSSFSIVASNVSLSTEIGKLKTNIQKSFQIIKLLKPSSRNETKEHALLVLENQLQTTSSIFFGSKSIGLWDMGGKYPSKKVKALVFHDIKYHYIIFREY